MQSLGIAWGGIVLRLVEVLLYKYLLVVDDVDARSCWSRNTLTTEVEDCRCILL